MTAIPPLPWNRETGYGPCPLCGAPVEPSWRCGNDDCCHIEDITKECTNPDCDGLWEWDGTPP